MEFFLAPGKHATVLSCYPVSCDYTQDNLEGASPADVFNLMNLMLEDFGADVLLSASEGPRFAQVMTEMVDQVKKLGPNLCRTN